MEQSNTLTEPKAKKTWNKPEIHLLSTDDINKNLFGAREGTIHLTPGGQFWSAAKNHQLYSAYFHKSEFHS